jgi:serine-type D-Ala-D-Ala carboxypeptidase (penicillin-binding protein 5/6)
VPKKKKQFTSKKRQRVAKKVAPKLSVRKRLGNWFDSWGVYTKMMPTVVLVLMLILSRQMHREQVLSAKTPVLDPIEVAEQEQVKPVVKRISQTNPAWVTARGVAIYDLQSWTLLYGKNETAELLPASTTKIMTALVALEIFDPQELVTITRADRTVGQTASLVPGEQFSVEDLLYALLLNSGNDAALNLAAHDPQGYADFVERMNARAAAMGLTHTRFANVSGLESPFHYSSAQDLAMITKVALENRFFRTIVATPSHTITSRSTRTTKRLVNLNQLLTSVEGVKGVKTGTTPQAGQCLITLVERDGHEVLIVVLGSQDRYQETTELIEWVYSSFRWD